MPENVSVYGGTAVRVTDREATSPRQWAQQLANLWYATPYEDPAVWVNSVTGVILGCRIQELDLDIDVQQRDDLFDWADSFEVVVNAIREETAPDTSHEAKKLRLRALPELGEVEVEQNPIIDIPARTGKTYPLRIGARMKVRFEPT